MRKQMCASALVVLLTLLGTVTRAAEAKHASIIGTYKLVARVYSDSTIKTGPNVVGLQTFTRTYRNFNVAWKDAGGKTFSYAVISKYTLTDSTYTETKLYSVMNDEIGGTGIKYDFEPKTEKVPVTIENGKASFKLPFDPVTVTVDGSKMTATGDAGFVDSWSRIK
jgi:hypothetical protein